MSSLRSSTRAWQSTTVTLITWNRVLWQWDLWDLKAGLTSLPSPRPSSCPSSAARAAHTRKDASTRRVEREHTESAWIPDGLTRPLRQPWTSLLLSFFLWNKLLLELVLVKMFCLQLITFLADKNLHCTGNAWNVFDFCTLSLFRVIPYSVVLLIPPY